MHEYSIIQGVLDTVIPACVQAGAAKLLRVRLRVGEMTEVVRESMDFFWDPCCDERGDLTRGCELEIEYITPRSVCMKCSHEFEHDRFHLECPQCGSYATLLLRGRELEVASMDVDIPEEDNTRDAGAVDRSGADVRKD